MSLLALKFLLHFYLGGLVAAQCEFEVIEEEDGQTTKHDQLGDDYEETTSNSESDTIPPVPAHEYPPSIMYMIWLKNNKSFPKWLYQTVETEDPSLSSGWRLDQLSKVYRKCDAISGGYPLSGDYIRDLLEMIYLQGRIDSGSIADDVRTVQDLEWLKSIRLPAANGTTIGLCLKNEGELLMQVAPERYLTALVQAEPSARNELYQKVQSLAEDYRTVSEETRDILRMINDIAESGSDQNYRSPWNGITDNDNVKSDQESLNGNENPRSMIDKHLTEEMEKKLKNGHRIEQRRAQKDFPKQLSKGPGSNDKEVLRYWENPANSKKIRKHKNRDYELRNSIVGSVLRDLYNKERQNNRKDYKRKIKHRHTNNKTLSNKGIPNSRDARNNHTGDPKKSFAENLQNVIKGLQIFPKGSITTARNESFDNVMIY